MKKLLSVTLAVLMMVFSFVGFASAQDDPYLEKAKDVFEKATSAEVDAMAAAIHVQITQILQQSMDDPDYIARAEQCVAELSAEELSAYGYSSIEEMTTIEKMEVYYLFEIGVFDNKSGSVVLSYLYDAAYFSVERFDEDMVKNFKILFEAVIDGTYPHSDDPFVTILTYDEITTIEQLDNANIEALILKLICPGISTRLADYILTGELAPADTNTDSGSDSGNSFSDLVTKILSSIQNIVKRIYDMIINLIKK